jgi:hypothetical protein
LHMYNMLRNHVGKTYQGYSGAIMVVMIQYGCSHVKLKLYNIVTSHRNILT